MARVGRQKYGITKEDSSSEALLKAQNGTQIDIEEMLRKHRVALMVRPTGFGKSYTLVKLCGDLQIKKAVYLYPMLTIKQSVEADYLFNPVTEVIVKHKDGSVMKRDKDGTTEKPVYANDKKIAETYGIPYIELITYKLMLDSWRAVGDAALKTGKSSGAAQKAWLKSIMQDADILILDEAHGVGAEGFLEYWAELKKYRVKSEKHDGLMIVGATATPERTKEDDIDIEKEVFYYGSESNPHSARIRDFSIEDCWDANILPKPFYTKCVLNKENTYSKLQEQVKNAYMGPGSRYAKYVVTGKDTAKHSKVTIVSSGFKSKTEAKCTSTINDIGNKLKELPDAGEIIYNATRQTSYKRLSMHKYLRFIVFYSNSDGMLEYCKNIEDEIKKAFLSNENTGYSEVNSMYLSSTEPSKFLKAGIRLNKIKDLDDRDRAIADNPKVGLGKIDIVHTVNMLNMGYHVGYVTGVIIVRGTSSEIVYYQQIGRCMSVKHPENTPLIVDCMNADSKLFGITNDSLRQAAADRLASFIDNCDKSQEMELVNNIYSYVESVVGVNRLPDDFLKYMYFNRQAPIYFTYLASKALRSNEGLESIIMRLTRMSRNNGVELENDDYLLEKNAKRLSPKILKLMVEVKKLVKKVGEDI